MGGDVKGEDVRQRSKLGMCNLLKIEPKVVGIRTIKLLPYNNNHLVIKNELKQGGKINAKI